MSREAAKNRAKAILSVLGDILWRSFGLAWYVVPTGMGIGSIPALGANWITGGLIAFLAAFVIAAREMGKEIAMTATLSAAEVARAFRKAIAQAEQTEIAQQKKAQADKKK